MNIRKRLWDRIEVVELNAAASGGAEGDREKVTGRPAFRAD